MKKETFRIEGLSCGVCAANSQRALSNMEGVKNVTVSLEDKTTLIEYDEFKVGYDEMKAQLSSIGYQLV